MQDKQHTELFKTKRNRINYQGIGDTLDKPLKFRIENFLFENYYLLLLSVLSRVSKVCDEKIDDGTHLVS